MEWINAELLPEHIVVRSLEEDMFDGLILHHLFRKWLPPTCPLQVGSSPGLTLPPGWTLLSLGLSRLHLPPEHVWSACWEGRGQRVHPGRLPRAPAAQGSRRGGVLLPVLLSQPRKGPQGCLRALGPSPPLSLCWCELALV